MVNKQLPPPPQRFEVNALQLPSGNRKIRRKRSARGAAALLLVLGVLPRAALAGHSAKPPAPPQPKLTAAQRAQRDQFFTAGDRHFADEEFAMALPLLWQAADLGSAPASYDLGLLYLYGSSNSFPTLRPDAEHALQLFEAAALAGEPRADSFIGQFYANPANGPVDRDAALFWYRRGLAAHDARSTLRLAELSCNGLGQRRDLAACGRLLRTAATYHAAHDRADVSIDLAADEAALGQSYASGNGAPRSFTQALAWDERAATLDNLQGVLAECYLFIGNSGLGEDLPRAERVLDAFTKRDANHPAEIAAAYTAIGARYEGRRPVDWVDADKLYVKAAARGQTAPGIALARRYMEGTGVDANLDIAYAIVWSLIPDTTSFEGRQQLSKVERQLAEAYRRQQPPQEQRAAELDRAAAVRTILPPQAFPEMSSVPPPAPFIERYPNMSAPDAVAVNQDFAVDVSLDKSQIDANTQILAGDQDHGKLKIPLPKGMTTMPIQVDLIAPAGITFADGANTATLTLDSTQDYSAPAEFHLKAGAAPLSATLMAILTYHQTFLARLARPIVITAANPAPTPTPIAHLDAIPAPMPNVGKPAPVIPVDKQNIVTDPGAKSVDVLITEAVGLNDNTLHYIIRGALGVQQEDLPQADVRRAAIGLVYTKLQKASQLLVPGFKLTSCVAPVRDPDIQQACATITNTRITVQGFGSDLYLHQAPQAFRDLITYMNANHLRLHTVTVVTDSATLPWELMWVPAADGTSNFLGLTASVVRQTMSAPQVAATEQVPFSGIAIIAPHYGNSTLDLQSAAREVAVVQADFPGLRTVAGNSTAVGALLEDPPQGIIHFTGHGQRDVIATATPASAPVTAPAATTSVPVSSTAATAPTAAPLDFDPALALAANVAIALDDESMEPDAFTGYLMDGSQKRAASQATDQTATAGKAPFYFFNACDLGRVDPQLGYATGWAPALMQTGASGFLGALYEVGDKSALSFATHFYTELKARMASADASWTMADVVTTARRATWAEANDPTVLAYVLYTKPFMRFVPAQP